MLASKWQTPSMKQDCASVASSKSDKGKMASNNSVKSNDGWSKEQKDMLPYTGEAKHQWLPLDSPAWLDR